MTLPKSSSASDVGAVVCTKCHTPNPAGTLRCSKCSSFLPGNAYAWKTQPEDAPKNSTAKHNENEARKLVKDQGLVWDELDAVLKFIVIAGVSSKATSADRAAMLRQLELLKPVPKTGKDRSDDGAVVVIRAENIENARVALKALKELGDG